MTISDEDDIDPFVNVVVAVQDGYLPPPSTPSPDFPFFDRLNRALSLTGARHRSSKPELTVGKPIKGIWPSDQGTIKIPTKPKKAAPPQPETNGHGLTNGHGNLKRTFNGAADDSAPAKRPRQSSIDLEEISEVPFPELEKATSESADVIIIEDDGAIVID